MVQNNDVNVACIRFLKKYFPTIPLALLYQAIRKKRIILNEGRIKNFNTKLKLKDTIKYAPFLAQYHVYKPLTLAKPYHVHIVYDQNDLLVIKKPSGLAVHHPDPQKSLDKHVLAMLISQNRYQQTEQSFIVSHTGRLDKLTTGLVVYPLSRYLQKFLMQNWNNHKRIIKLYHVQVEGHVLWDTLKTQYYCYKDEAHNKMVVTDQAIANSKPVVTIFHKIAYAKHKTCLQAELVTGRKHQIRATLAFLKHPVVGDIKYGAQPQPYFALYAFCVSFLQESLSSPSLPSQPIKMPLPPHNCCLNCIK